MGRRILIALRAWLSRHAGLLLVTAAALAVRLVWNLVIHRPLDFAYSDMGGYLDRADRLLDRPWRPEAYLSLFPYGTHVFIFVVKRVLGRANAAAVGVAFAVVGTLAVSFTYATAKRFCSGPWAPRVVAAILIGYYPWISLGGYALSEMPFALTVAASAFFALRLADRGSRGDAWLLGLSLGIGATVRPQILVGAVLLGLHFVLRRRGWRGSTRGLLPRMALPLVAILAISAVRVHWLTRHWGLVSTNGPMNAVFGRCHNTGLNAHARDGAGFFGPPALGALLEYEKGHPNALFKLDPAMGTTLTFKGHMWDAEPTEKLSAACIEKTGWLRQIKYAVTHVVLLWHYNSIWPDQGQKAKWSRPMAIACEAHTMWILPPAAIAMLLAFRKRRARSMLLALHVWGLVVVAMLYFGDTRYRAPYDGLLIVLAIATYFEIPRWLARAVRFVRSLRRAP